ncbi:hypothetical protein EK904_014164, partial [Melospiza melodia maxima]
MLCVCPNPKPTAFPWGGFPPASSPCPTSEGQHNKACTPLTSTLAAASVFTLCFPFSWVLSSAGQPPPRPPQPTVLLTKPCYDPVSEEEEGLPGGLRKLCLKKPGTGKGLRPVKPSARVPGTKVGERQPRRLASEGTASSEVTLIDFGEEVPQGSPSPVGELTALSLAELAMEAFSLLDKTPPQSPTRALPRPLHPTPVVDWDARPLPPPPAYDD